MKIKRKFKENLALMVAVVLVLQLMTPGMVYAEDQTVTDVDGNTYTYIIEDGNATITDFSVNTNKIITIPSEFNGYQVTKIGLEAFKELNLMSVTIPNTITEIGESAFSDNYLASVTIPKSVTSIGNNAFNNNGLSYAIIKNSQATFGSNVFANQANGTMSIRGYLGSTAVTYASSNGHPFNSLGVDIDGVDTYDGNTYNYTDNGDGTATITDFTSGGLNDIEIPSTVDGLTVTKIDVAAFKEKNLASVVIPDSVTEIGESAFEDNMLSSISIPKNVKSIGDSAFCNQYFYDEDEDEDVATLSAIDFAEESALESLGMCAFSNNIIEEVVLPEGLKTIGNFAFDVNKLAEITIPASVISIGNNAFSENQLNKAIILDSSTTIGTDAFSLNLDELAIFGYANSTAEVYADSNNHKFACIPSGDGSQENPYEIKNAGNLVWMSSENSDLTGKYFKQTDDIDMSDMSDFVSIGEYTSPFNGKYDGSGYKISDLQITSDKMFTGLFGFIGSSGEVKRVTLVDVSIDSTYDNNQPGGIGGIAGGSGGTILDCHITRSEGNESVIASTGQNAIIGGIVGDNSGTISRCSNNADVKAEGGTNAMYAIGGIAGSNNRIIEDCFNTGDVSDVDGKAALIYLGGIAGSNGDTIKHCFSTGTIDTSYEYASKGGVVGTTTSVSASKITDNYYLDETATNGIGAIGFNPGTSVGAESKESDALKNPETFSDWDTEKWNFSEDNLPGLKPVLDENGTTEEKSAPEISVADSAVDIDSETMGLSFESSEAWIKKLNGAVITLDGVASPVEGMSKWTIEAEKIGIMTGDPNQNFDDYYMRADGVSNTQIYIKFQIGEKPENRICKTGNYTLILKADGYPDASVTFNISSGEFTGIKVITQPSNVTSGGNVGAVKVALVDQFGNTISHVQGKAFSDVTASAKNAAFTIGGVTTASFDENGVATFSGITSTKTEGLSGATLRFSTIESYLFMRPALQGSIQPETHTCDSAAFNINASAPSNNDVETQPLPKKEDKMSVVVDGKTQDNAATVTTTTGKDGQTTTMVSLDKNKITETLEKMSKKSNDDVKPMISIPINNDSDKVVGELNGQIVKSMEDKEVVLEIKTQTATYTLPSSEINIATVSESLGENLTLSDIKVQIEISKPDAATVKVIEDTANNGGYTLVASPVEFRISCSYGDKSVEVSKFNNYVERTVAIPEGVDPSKITTGVVIELDGTVRHVPTRIIVIDGKYYAQINSLTNSTYSVIWHPKEFKDVENHWAKGAINDMGSRMVINGTDSEIFDPNRDITRAEFAAIIVRALGLKPETGTMTFTDVKPTDWYSDYVLTAAEYNIVSGYENGKFGPDDKLTREQAMSMIARAMKVTKLNVELSEAELANLMGSFTDSNEVASYANNHIAECIKAGIVTGRDSSSLAPKANITRAEVAVIIRNLLQKSSLI